MVLKQLATNAYADRPVTNVMLAVIDREICVCLVLVVLNVRGAGIDREICVCFVLVVLNVRFAGIDR